MAQSFNSLFWDSLCLFAEALGRRLPPSLSILSFEILMVRAASPWKTNLTFNSLFWDSIGEISSDSSGDINSSFNSLFWDSQLLCWSTNKTGWKLSILSFEIPERKLRFLVAINGVLSILSFEIHRQGFGDPLPLRDHFQFSLLRFDGNVSRTTWFALGFDFQFSLLRFGFAGCSRM